MKCESWLLQSFYSTNKMKCYGKDTNPNVPATSVQVICSPAAVAHLARPKSESCNTGKKMIKLTTNLT